MLAVECPALSSPHREHLVDRALRVAALGLTLLFKSEASPVFASAVKLNASKLRLIYHQSSNFPENGKPNKLLATA